MDFHERVVVTGLGVVSPLGVGLDSFHEGLSEGKNGISTLNLPWKTGYERNQAGIVHDFKPPLTQSNDLRSCGRTTQLAITASKMALEQAGLQVGGDATRVGVIVGTAMGQALEQEKNWNGNQSPGKFDLKAGKGRRTFLPRQMNDEIGAFFGFEGPNHLVTTTCAAGNHAIAWASDLIRTNVAEAMVAVGVDTIGYVDLLGFSRLLLQDPDCCRPFDLHRKGTILSEGAGALVLEPLHLAKQRGASILAEVAGCGLSCDAGGSFASKKGDVRSLEIAAEEAFREAQCGPDDIQYISAHGSGTRLNDAKETYFIKKVFGERAYRIPVSSIKSMLGHAQGAASSLEAIACVLSLQNNVVYPTINYQTPDPQCDLDYVPNQARECQLDTIMSNAFGIGGNNAIVILRRYTG